MDIYLPNRQTRLVTKSFPTINTRLKKLGVDIQNFSFLLWR